MKTLTAPERKALAEKVGVDEQYLYQCLTGRKSMKTKEAVRVERESEGVLRRWDLRVHDWWEQWPDLMEHPDAPPIKQVA